MSHYFSDQIITKARTQGHSLCVGLDPHLQQIPPLFRRGSMNVSDPETPGAIQSFLSAIVGLVAEHAIALKPQIAFFEPMGSKGFAALEAVLKEARGQCPIIMDAKRGDIGSTASAYATAYLTPGAPLEADALTINPYLGTDSLEPFLAAAERHGKGLFVLVKTSNPGSAEFQDQEVLGEPLFQRVADALAPHAVRLNGPETGWSGLGVVVGATKAEQAPAIRGRLPKSLFLVPGFGAQGGSARDAVQGYVPGPKGLEGGVINASRSILFPEAGNVEDAARWEAAIVDNLARTIDELRSVESAGAQ